MPAQATSLGRLNCEVAPRARTTPEEVKVAIPASSSTMATKTSKFGMSVPKGILPVTFFSLFFLAFPLLQNYYAFDYTDTTTRACVITSSFLAALFVLLANDCVAWFNMILFFHIGLEVVVLDTLMTFAQASTTDDVGVALGWTAFGVILLHLVPFLLVDHSGVLTLLAFAGTVVNTSALVFVDPSQMLLVGFSSSMLLIAVLLIACIDCVSTSLLTQFRSALTHGTWIVCGKYE